jgi:sugar lactone lactonase YvrE
VTGIDTNGLAFGPDGNLYAANHPGNQVYEVTPDGVVSTFATGIAHPAGLTFDSSGNLYVAEVDSNQISRINPGGVVSTFATGIATPVGLAFDGSGNLYVSSQTGGYVDEITPGGVVSTFATGFATPVGLAFASSGNLYVANNANGTISKVTPGGIVSTFATGFNGRPEYIGFDGSGNLYVPEYDSGTVSRVGPGGGTGTLFATGFSGAESVAVVLPTAVATTTTLNSDHPGGSIYGQPVTFTANVTAPSGTPTGSVDFFDTTTNTDLGTVALPAAAPTFDANADFEAGWAAGTNPNGVWSYGRTTDLGGPLTLFTRHYIPPVNNNLEHGWDDPSDSSGFTPSVARNAGGDFNNGNVTFQAGALILHPCGVSGHDDAHVIFTAPAAGSYSLTGDFFAQQNNINVDVHVLVNGGSVFDSTITSNGVSRPFSGTFALAAGDTIDFAVGPNGNFVQHPGNTGLNATITPVPQGAVQVTSSLGAGTHNITAAYTSNSSVFLDSATPSPLAQAVSPAPLTVTAADATRTYGSPNPTFTGTITGVQNNDNISALYSTAATPASDVGTYPITPTLIDPSNLLGNYTITLNNGTLSITKAHLTVTANDLTVIYHNPNPALTYTVSGFVLGQTLATSGITGAPALGTAYTASSPVGTYSITVTLGTLSAKNYDFTSFVPGTLTVTYGIKVLFDQNQATNSGSTLPVAIQLTDYYGNNVSSVGIGVHALYVAPASNPEIHLPAKDPGNSQPGGDFRFTGNRYRYNLQTTGLADGIYDFYFTVDGDPLVHSVPFIIG